ncbi:MAG: hypothetical protein KAZ71_04705 [Bacteroidia bacterium]|nr:hypothetical protein [Bacteroidia bacterium]
MQTIFTTITREELIKRINILNSNSKAQWGKMDVYQILKHSMLYFSIILFAISLLSCSPETDKKYNKNGITFKYLSSWEAETDADVKDRCSSVTIKKKSFFAKLNNVFITYFNDSTDVVELLNDRRESDKSTFSVFNAKFDTISKSIFNGYHGYKFDWRMNTSGYETIYSYQGFNIKNRTVLIEIAQSAEDTLDNKVGISKILTNLSFK